MLYPRNDRPERPGDRQRSLAIGAAVLFGVAAFLAFVGAFQGAFGFFAAAMAFHAAASAPAPDPQQDPRAVAETA